MWWWAALYAALSLVVTFPLVTHLRSAVPKDLGDPLLSAALLWWNAHVLPFTARWWDGPAFYPASGTLAFSDHRLGVSLLAMPLQWLGASPVTASNVVFVTSFALSAIAAHLLAYRLTRRHDCAAICGLAFGFSPFRIAHVSHLELLATFPLPLALLALHGYLEHRRRRWLVALAVALVLLGLCATYYLLFFCVLLALWMSWFLRPHQWRSAAGIAAAALGGALALLPVALGYSSIHDRYGFARFPDEIALFSADVTSLVTASSNLKLWGWTSVLNPHPEHQLFPGFIIAMLTAYGVIAAVRREPPRSVTWRTRATLALLAVGVIYVGVAISVARLGPWRVEAGPLVVSATVTHKPLTVVVVAMLLAAIVQPCVAVAWRRRSWLAFYAGATFVLIVCSFGRTPTFLGTQVLYEPPYAWLMRLPLFSTGVRAPARFAMLAMLTLSVAGALAFQRLRMRDSMRRAVGPLLMLGIVADTWVLPMPLAKVPESWPVPRGRWFGSVLELPLDEGDRDFRAMYRATVHGHPLVNGSSGYTPPHYRVLSRALQEHDATAFEGLQLVEPMLVVVERAWDPGGRWEAFMQTTPGATPVASEEASAQWAMYTVAPGPSPAPCAGRSLPVARVFGEGLGGEGLGGNDFGPLGTGTDLTSLTDDDAATVWASPTAQRAGMTLTVDLGRAADVCAVQLTLGRLVVNYPRALSVAASLDLTTWTPVYEGRPAGLALRSALQHPREARMQVPAVAHARFVRLRLEASHSQLPWTMFDLTVVGPIRSRE